MQVHNICLTFLCRSSVSSAGDVKEDDAMPQYHVDKSFADRRYKVNSARTYFYLNEATCERNMETFIKCLEAVSGNYCLYFILFEYIHTMFCIYRFKNILCMHII